MGISGIGWRRDGIGVGSIVSQHSVDGPRKCWDITKRVLSCGFADHLRERGERRRPLALVWVAVGQRVGAKMELAEI